ncbi:sulfite exporter TauE/SafE family protein [Acaryochloris sp. CCMEE 5410]|uniref:urease accessory protein UreH domain-containing protein n=1 Tax=Acaryochloris sp. CCMEE 5410 TaxID=310037 RepID=UPI0002484940|nr:sulfite exporter TauE/SafE family protein [Acaryochloris sp. CCMEE 5410]
MLDLLLVTALGFVGSFGHCVGMCGPLAASFALTSGESRTWRQQLTFHVLLNLGRTLSYGLIGAAIGALSSVLVAGGELAGIDSVLRRSIALLMGGLLIWLGIRQIRPGWLPKLPLPHPLLKLGLHERFNRAMTGLAHQPHWWTPALLGMIWGLIPCGFLYAAQIKAAATGNWLFGSATMLCFGLGTMPTLLGVGFSTAILGQDRRSQLFQLGGWLMLIIGVLTVLRTGEMQDYSSHTALLLLMLALLARPIQPLWSAPLHYRRLFGVGAFVLSLIHVLRVLDHSFQWSLTAIPFMLPLHQAGLWAGVVALALLIPLATTSTNGMVQRLGPHWRRLHLLSIPALLLAGSHTVMIGSHYLGGLEWTGVHLGRTVAIATAILLVLLIRCRWVWALFSLEKFYGASSPLR